MPIALVLLLSLLAQASVPPSADNKAKAQALLREGTALYERGDLTGALEKFEGAYAVFPSPKLQFNIGQANRDLGRPVDALLAFETFLANAKDAAPELVSEARQSAADLAAKLGRLKVECPTTGADVTLDGKPLGTTPSDRLVWVVPGQHQLTIRGRTFMPVIADLKVAAGETQLVRRTLVLTERVAPPSLSPQTTANPAVVERRPSPAPTSPNGVLSRQRWYFWAAAGGAAAFAAGAIAAGLSAGSRFNTLQGSCGQTTAGCTDDQINSVTSRETLANVLWALAGASAVGAGVAFYIDSRETVASIALRF
jgi:hypothetical protein